jgi:predicted transcriptional regulator
MDEKPNPVVLTASIVAAYVKNNSLPPSELPGLIRDVYHSIHHAGNGAESAPDQQPAVAIKKSVTPDYIICLEDGRKFKSLRRHLRSQFNMTPDEYRAKWGLPRDYPMVAPNYAERRSELAREMGLGRGRGVRKRKR